MTIKDFLLRFAVGYFVLEMLIDLIMKVSGITVGGWTTGVEIGIISGLTIWLCTSFGKKNGRYFTSHEKNLTILGMVAIDISLQFLFLFSVFGINNSLKSSSLILSIFLVFVHLPFIYLYMNVCKRELIEKKIIII